VTDYPPEVEALLARGAEVLWRPDGCGGAVIIGVAWPLRWDAPRFRTVPDGQCVPRRQDGGPAVLPRLGPAHHPVKIAGP
jgi:hypothetical protein